MSIGTWDIDAGDAARIREEIEKEQLDRDKEKATKVERYDELCKKMNGWANLRALVYKYGGKR